MRNGQSAFLFGVLLFGQPCMSSAEDYINGYTHVLPSYRLTPPVYYPAPGFVTDPWIEDPPAYLANRYRQIPVQQPGIGYVPSYPQVYRGATMSTGLPGMVLLPPSAGDPRRVQQFGPSYGPVRSR